MRQVLLVTLAALALSTPAFADSIGLVAKVDGTTVATDNSLIGTLNVADQFWGLDFDLNSVTANSQSLLTAPDVFKTQTLNINQLTTGSHTLTIAITANDLAGTNALDAILSEFSVTGLTGGWTVEEQTFINGVLQASTPVFTANSDDLDVSSVADLTNPFSAEVLYTIVSNGKGSFNGGIDIQASPVPGPVVGAGLPGLIACCIGLVGLARRRRNATA
jgi:hypothetical protein